jgi:hypothetical protein
MYRNVDRRLTDIRVFQGVHGAIKKLLQKAMAQANESQSGMMMLAARQDRRID